jgi:hypothetical protein
LGKGYVDPFSWLRHAASFDTKGSMLNPCVKRDGHGLVSLLVASLVATDSWLSSSELDGTRSGPRQRRFESSPIFLWYLAKTAQPALFSKPPILL